MELIVLGSGTCVPDPVRYPSSHLLRLDDGELWLLDVGVGCLQQLMRAGENPNEIDHIFISHNHPDHVGGLAALIQSYTHAPGFKRESTLNIYGSNDVGNYLHYVQSFSASFESGFDIAFHHLVDGQEFVVGEAILRTAAAIHPIPTQALRVESYGKVLLYGADGAPCDAVTELAIGADLLLLEAAYPSSMKSDVHQTIVQAVEVALNAKARKLVLVHLYPEVLAMSHDQRCSEFKTLNYSGEVIFADDLARFIF